MRVRRAAEAQSGSRASFDLILTAACPRCQAPITVEEGTTAAVCPADRETFLVAPLTHPIEVVVAATVRTAEARHEARTYLRAGQHRATWIGRGGWRLLPYWRYRAKAFQWVEGLRQGPPGSARMYHDLEVRVFDLLLPASSASPIDLPPRPGTFAARILRPEMLTGVSLAPVELPEDAARVRGMSEVEVRTETAGPRLLKRRLTLVGEELLVVHLPFFSLEYRFQDELSEVLVDGILGGVAAHRKLDHPSMTSAPSKTPFREATPLFLPLACPSCKGSFNFVPGDRLHCCTTCGRAWESTDERMIEVAHRLAITAGAQAPGARYLPFWVVAAQAKGFKPFDVAAGEAGEIRVYVPAFESWQIEKLVHLGVRLTRARPRYPTLELGGAKRGDEHEVAGSGSPASPSANLPSLTGATLRRQEAERLAWVILGSLASSDPSTFIAFMEDGSVVTGGAELHWLPFRPSGLYLHEPLSGALVRPSNLGEPVSEDSPGA